jgi:hypothetical protein
VTSVGSNNMDDPPRWIFKSLSEQEEIINFLIKTLENFNVGVNLETLESFPLDQDAGDTAINE